MKPESDSKKDLFRPIVSRTDPSTLASELERLNDAVLVQSADQGISLFSQPADFQRHLLQAADTLSVTTNTTIAYNVSNGLVNQSSDQHIETIADAATAQRAGRTTCEALTFANQRDQELSREHDRGPLTRTAVRYLEALLLRNAVFTNFLHGPLKQADIVLCPTLTIPVPTRLETDMEKPGSVFSVVGTLTRLTRPFSYLGVTVLTMPAGADKSGMPVGAQVIGRPLSDARLLCFAHHLS